MLASLSLDLNGIPREGCCLLCIDDVISSNLEAELPTACFSGLLILLLLELKVATEESDAIKEAFLREEYREDLMTGSVLFPLLSSFGLSSSNDSRFRTTIVLGKKLVPQGLEAES